MPGTHCYVLECVNRGNGHVISGRPRLQKRNLLWLCHCIKLSFSVVFDLVLSSHGRSNVSFSMTPPYLSSGLLPSHYCILKVKYINCVLFNSVCMQVPDRMKNHSR